MTSLLQNLNNIRTLRAMARDFSLEVLEDMQEKLRIVIEEKRVEQLEAEQQRAEQQQKIAALLERMKADGISAEDLLGSEAAIGAAQPKNVKFVRLNTVLLMPMGRKKPGPARDVRLSLFPSHWKTVNRWMIF